MKTLSSYYTDALKRALMQGGTDVENGTTFGPSCRKIIRPLYNRIVNNPAGKIVAAERGDWGLADMAEHIANGEILADAETVLWYVFDNYAPPCNQDHYQVSLATMCEDNDVIKCHADKVICWLLGLTAKYPELVNFSPTHGLNVLTLKQQKIDN
jgi:hypothetical protein